MHDATPALPHPDDLPHRDDLPHTDDRAHDTRRDRRTPEPVDRFATGVVFPE